MNIQQAKQQSLPELLSRLGYEPVEIKKGGAELWYRSPFRNEQAASFQVSKGKVLPWVWNDFGDASGHIVDFVMRYQGYSRVQDALRYLDGVFGSPVRQKSQSSELPFSFYQSAAELPEDEKASEPTQSDLELLRVHSIQNPVIYRYLEGRGIPRNLAHRYLKEIRYRNRNTQKVFFAFGMENRVGGYEIRSATDDYVFKSSLNGKALSFFAGSRQPSRSVNIFEGMLDFLSLLVMMNISQASGDSIVLHSLSSFKRAEQLIQANDYTTINSFLDNNRAGRQKHGELVEIFGEDRVQNQSHWFEPYEDLNEALQANQLPDFLSPDH